MYEQVIAASLKVRFELDSFGNNWAFIPTDPGRTAFNGPRYYENFMFIRTIFNTNGFDLYNAGSFFYMDAKYLDFSVDLGPEVLAMSTAKLQFMWEELKVFFTPSLSIITQTLSTTPKRI